MFMPRKSVPLALALAALGTTACADDDDGGTAAAERKAYVIELEPGHTHVFKTYEVTFAVRDMGDCTDHSDTSTCAGVPGLPVRIWSQPFGEEAETQRLAPDVLVDNGDGTYTWTTHFEWFVPYVVGFEFEEDGNTYSEAFPYETSKAGGESIFCPTLPDPVPEGWTPAYNYQVRWHANPGHIVADGTTRVAFDLDLRRTIEVTNVAQPFRNAFDHLVPDNLEIPDGGTAADKLTVHILDPEDTDTPLATYKFGSTDADVRYVGLGIYRVTHVFSPEDVGQAATRPFMLRVIFDDDATDGTEPCPVVDETDDEASSDYTFPVYAPRGG